MWMRLTVWDDVRGFQGFQMNAQARIRHQALKLETRSTCHPLKREQRAIEEGQCHTMVNMTSAFRLCEKFHKVTLSLPLLRIIANALGASCPVQFRERSLLSLIFDGYLI